MSSITYSKIVFGLKHFQQIYDCRKFMELIRSLRIIISEHDAKTDVCERPGKHYHGIIEHGKPTYKNDNKVIAHLKTLCVYFRIQMCDNPEQYVAELALPPKKMMIIEIEKSYNLKLYYSTIRVAGCRLGCSDFEKEAYKMEALKLITTKLTTRKIFDKDEIYEEIKNSWFCLSPNEVKTVLTYSVDLLQRKMLDQSILDLCGRFTEILGNYYTLQESTDLIAEWCLFQNIDLEKFTMNIVKCFDRQVWYKNALYFQGSSESGILNIINSVAEACAFIGEIDRETTGYTYVWEDCIEKRCIIMKDPTFDDERFEELENIVKGIGTFVPHRQGVLKYLRPTPVIVICIENDEVYLHRLQTSFIENYFSLKPFTKLMNGTRRLHPDWLNVVYMHFSGCKIENTNFHEDTVEGSMDSDSSNEWDEVGSNNSIESVSSTAALPDYSPGSM